MTENLFSFTFKMLYLETRAGKASVKEPSVAVEMALQNLLEVTECIMTSH